MIKKGIFVFIICLIFLSLLINADNSDNCYIIEHINSTTSKLVNICNNNLSIIILGPSVIINNTIIPVEELTHSSATRYLLNCEPDWQCSHWSACNGQSVTRKCTDTNNCVFKYNKPIEISSCGLIGNSLVQGNNMLFISAGIAIFLLLFIILIIILTK